jgi:adenylate cyclase
MSFFDELKRRNVVRVGLAYGIAGWVILQVADLVLENIDAPPWVIQALMLFVLLGFIAALVIAWAYEITPEGIKKESEVDRSQSIGGHTGKKLDRIIIGFLVVAVAVLLIDRSMSPSEKGPDTFSEDTTMQVSQTVDDNTPIGEEALTSDPSIAVLPFADMSPDQDQGYFSDGISEELLNLLVRVDGLKVASRTSSFTYKGSKQNLAEIADELKVDHVLEGSVRKADNRLRITAQLIDAKTDRHIWSDTFDRELVDIFAIQDEIANAIVTALSTELGILQDIPAISVAAATENLDAYELYLKARGLFLARERLEESVSLFEQAVEIDPDFARAWGDLAAIYAIVESWGYRGRDWDSLATQAAERALALDPALSMPWAVKGQIALNRGDSIAGMANYDRAIDQDSSNATLYLWRGIAYSQLGFHGDSVADLEQCLEIDPAYENCRRHMAFTFQILGDNERAMTLFQQGYERGFKGSEALFTQRFLSQGERLLGAMVLYSRIDDDSTFPGKSILDAMEFPERDHSRGLEKMLIWIDQSETIRPIFPMVMSAFKAYHLVEWFPFFNRWIWLSESKGFRESEYFRPFMDRMGAPAYWRKHGFPPACRPLGEEDYECD